MHLDRSGLSGKKSCLMKRNEEKTLIYAKWHELDWTATDLMEWLIQYVQRYNSECRQPSLRHSVGDLSKIGEIMNTKFKKDLDPSLTAWFSHPQHLFPIFLTTYKEMRDHCTFCWSITHLSVSGYMSSDMCKYIFKNLFFNWTAVKIRSSDNSCYYFKTSTSFDTA